MNDSYVSPFFDASLPIMQRTIGAKLPLLARVRSLISGAGLNASHGLNQAFLGLNERDLVYF
jgi:hypothetical protein